jgi:hydrogenase maturation protease
VNTGRPGIDQPGFGPDSILLGIGNSGRADDGLGWAFLDRIRRETDFPGHLEYRYQLQVEDAELVSRAERVVFVDSHQGNLTGGFQWQPCVAAAHAEFTSHLLPPGAIMHLCRTLYGRMPRADLLMIQGRCWDLRIGMSPAAERHLDSAVRFFKDRLPARQDRDCAAVV